MFGAPGELPVADEARRTGVAYEQGCDDELQLVGNTFGTNTTVEILSSVIDTNTTWSVGLKAS